MKRLAQPAARPGKAALAAMTLCLAALPARAADHAKDRGPVPAARIPVAPLGYRPPGRLYLLARYSSSSIDFLDARHLLLTFRQPHLLRRSQGSADGLDQVVRAEVLDLATGRVTAEDDWLLHDRARYLWKLGEDSMLLRVGARLYTVDAALHTQELYRSSAGLEGVDTSPDGRLLILEEETERHSAEEHERLTSQAAARGIAPPEEDVRVRVFRLDSRLQVLAGRTTAAGEIPATVDGFFRQSRRDEATWELSFIPYEQAAAPEPAGRPVTGVASVCAPEVKVLDPQTILALSCPPGHGGRYISAYARDGRKLWDGSWNSSYTWPAFRVADNGSAVAISWLQVLRPVSAEDPINDEDVKRQVLSVLDSRTGALRLALLLDPIVSAGGNFALSADGSRLAVLNRGELQVYDLGPAAPSAESERASR